MRFLQRKQGADENSFKKTEDKNDHTLNEQMHLL